MVLYTCLQCNYESNDKSNYGRHMSSWTHIRNTSNSIQNNTKESKNDDKYLCDCGKYFSHRSSLYRHKKTCKDNKDEKIDNLTNKVEELANAVGLMAELIKNNNHTTNNFNISIKSYIQKYYPGAPILYEPNDYSKLTYDNAELIDILLYKYKHKCLHEYLGDFLVDYYKKEDPAEQSVWSSDISRLTYIVKEALANKESIWNHDYKGVKTKKCIIDPLLQHIKKYIASYWEKNLQISMKSPIDVDALAKRQEKYNITYAIETEIDNGSLANDIIRYIASYFHMDKNKHLSIIRQFIDNTGAENES